MTDKAKLLFVDDEERVVNLLRTMFRSEYEVFTATSGRDALDVLEAQRIDVIVSDQRMPGMAGIELLAEVRKRSPGTMRMLLTGYSDLTAIVGSVNDGEVFRFINKPWDHQEIKATIAQAVEAARATAEVAVHSDAAAPALLSSADQPALLVLDDAAADREAIVRLFSADYRVFSAGTIPEALNVLQRQDVGVIISEARLGDSDASELLGVLKQHYPTITSVVLTNVADADDVVRLINQVQIHRFATKPIRAAAFRLAVSGAMKAHLRMRQNPGLVKRHQVAAPARPQNPSLVAAVVQSLGWLRTRLLRFKH